MTVRKTARHAQLQDLNHPAQGSLDRLRDVQESLAGRIDQELPRPEAGYVIKVAGDIAAYQGDSRSLNEVNQDVCAWPSTPGQRNPQTWHLCLQFLAVWHHPREYKWMQSFHEGFGKIAKNVKCTSPDVAVLLTSISSRNALSFVCSSEKQKRPKCRSVDEVTPFCEIACGH